MNPIGLDGHTGKFFPEFSRGETLPFSFQILEEDEITPIDITGWKLYLTFATEQGLDSGFVEVILLPQDAANGIFSGSVTDDETFSLDAGTIYGSIKIINATGEAYLIDKARLTVGECVNPRRAQ